MKARVRLFLVRAVLSVGLCVAAPAAVGAAALPDNLARKAAASATSEYNGDYAARLAVDGKVPAAGGQADAGHAWCVKGDTHRNGAEFALSWPDPVEIAQVVYFGRTAWFAEECWKGYEILADGAASPVARGEFKRGHGPQAVTLPKLVRTRNLTLRFTSSYGGLNPGASEIMVFSKPVPDKALGRFVELPAGRPSIAEQPPVEVSPALEAAVKAGRLGFERLVLIQRRELNPTHVYTQHVEGFQPGGALCVLDVRTGELRKLVETPEGQILDCDVSYDGGEILFSWRRTPQDAYQLYRIRPDGSGLAPITSGEHHNYNACWLPDGGIAFLSTRRAQFAYCWVSPVGTVCRIEPDGSGFRQLSANYLNDFTPYVLNDGRIVYGRWEYVDRPAIPIQSLWTIQPDGTGLRVFFGNRVLSPATFIEPRPIPDSDKVLCILTAHNGPCRGAIGILEPARGVNAQAAIRNLTPEIDIGQVDRGSGNHIRGPYESPCPLDRKHFLVSMRGTILVRDYDGTEAAVVTGPRDGLGFYGPMPLRARPRPPAIPSTLPPSPPGEENANPENPVGWATLVLQDVYQGLEPHVKRGEVRQIRVVQELRKSVRTDVSKRAFGFQFPVVSCGATYAPKKVWGHVDVAPDGSACFQVPAGIPIYFEALDAEGRAVQRMRSFTHLMPGEQQGCIGCHENRLQAAPARRPAAMTAEPQPIRPPEWGGPKGFDYASVVQPVLDRACVRCHAPPDAPKGVDLTGDKTDFFNVSYETLARGRRGIGEGEIDNPYTSWIPTYNGQEANILEVTPRAWGSPASKLTQILLGGHPDPDGKPRIDVTDDERRRIFAWIDLNVPYYGTSETAYPERRGCRQILPDDLGKILADVGRRRCAECHADGKFPRKVWTRITNPQYNDFLLAPLAASAGGSGRCGRAVFADTNDPDYQAILKSFDPVLAMLKDRPRMDMPGAVPACDVNRSTK